MTIMPLKKDWTLCVIEAGESSPMENHGFMELAADDENKRIFASETLVRAYGTRSVKQACLKYVG